MNSNRKEILKYQLKSVNPFQGLVIDADTWNDAHTYHRDHQRLHLLMFHSTGIIEGLGVTAGEPADLAVNISPGIAVDEEGNIIIVGQGQRYRIQSREKGLIYLILQFREVPGEPYQQPDNQPTRILEAYRIQERDKLPEESCLELARIEFNPAQTEIKNAANPVSPAANEINLKFRKEVNKDQIEQKTVTQPDRLKKLFIGHSIPGSSEKDLHARGLRNLLNSLDQQGRYETQFKENISLEGNLAGFTLVYLAGTGPFQLNQKQQASLTNYLKGGGLIIGEGCNDGQESRLKGAKEFGLSFNQLAAQLGFKLEMIKREHPLLSARNVFSEAPPGCESSAMLLEGGSMIYSGCDYGCAWSGGYSERPLSRETIRNAFEMGENFIAYALNRRA